MGVRSSLRNIVLIRLVKLMVRDGGMHKSPFGRVMNAGSDRRKRAINSGTEIDKDKDGKKEDTHRHVSALITNIVHRVGTAILGT